MTESITLEEAIRNRLSRPPRPADEPSIVYCPAGDYLVICFRDVPHFEEQVNSTLTLHRAIDGGDPVGCQIYGVSGLLRQQGKQ